MRDIRTYFLSGVIDPKIIEDMAAYKSYKELLERNVLLKLNREGTKNVALVEFEEYRPEQEKIIFKITMGRAKL